MCGSCNKTDVYFAQYSEINSDHRLLVVAHGIHNRSLYAFIELHLHSLVQTECSGSGLLVMAPTSTPHAPFCIACELHKKLLHGLNGTGLLLMAPTSTPHVLYLAAVRVNCTKSCSTAFGSSCRLLRALSGFFTSFTESNQAASSRERSWSTSS